MSTRWNEELDHAFARERRSRPELPPEVQQIRTVHKETDAAWRLELWCGVRAWFPKSQCTVAETDGRMWLRCPAWLWERKRKELTPQRVEENGLAERYARGCRWKRLRASEIERRRKRNRRAGQRSGDKT